MKNNLLAFCLISFTLLTAFSFKPLPKDLKSEKKFVLIGRHKDVTTSLGQNVTLSFLIEESTGTLLSFKVFRPDCLQYEITSYTGTVSGFGGPTGPWHANNILANLNGAGTVGYNGLLDQLASPCDGD